MNRYVIAITNPKTHLKYVGQRINRKLTLTPFCAACRFTKEEAEHVKQMLDVDCEILLETDAATTEQDMEAYRVTPVIKAK